MSGHISSSLSWGPHVSLWSNLHVMKITGSTVLCIILKWHDSRKSESTEHYTDVIMTTMASQITSLTVVYSTVHSDADQRKHQSSASLAFVWGIHRDRWIPDTKGQLRGKCFHLMTSSWLPVEIITIKQEIEEAYLIQMLYIWLCFYHIWQIYQSLRQLERKGIGLVNI